MSKDTSTRNGDLAITYQFRPVHQTHKAPLGLPRGMWGLGRGALNTTMEKTQFDLPLN
jgi:hypothetical protein